MERCKNTQMRFIPKNTPLTRRRSRGFSLIEMIGVLAIIAVLAVVIVPKVFSTISASRVTGAVGSVEAVKTATADFVGRYGTIPVTTANSRVDDLLLAAQYLDSRFVSKIGTPPSNPALAGAVWTYANGAWAAAGGVSQVTQTRVICLASTAVAPSAANGANFQLDGINNLPVGSLVISSAFVNVTASDAQSLSLKIDGDSLSAANLVAADNSGKVVYAAPNAAGLTTVYVYIASQ
jgi:prepilin-type N-terminal cleavage/methylation domain-containing protein